MARWYTGSADRTLTRFEAARSWTAFDGKKTQRPIWLTQDPAFAQLYAGHHGCVYEVTFTPRKTFPAAPLEVFDGRWVELTEEGQRLLSLLTTGEIPLVDMAQDLDDREYVAREVVRAIARYDYDVMETHALMTWVKAQGYDSMWVRGDGPENLAVFDPTKVKIVAKVCT